MEAIRLIYNSFLKIVIYIEYGYYLLPSRVKIYLRGLHITKGVGLKTVYEELETLELVDPSTLRISLGLYLILYLNIELGF